MVGAMALQGAHHVAQKSTRTGIDDCRTSASKLLSPSVSTFSPAMKFLLFHNLVFERRHVCRNACRYDYLQLMQRQGNSYFCPPAFGIFYGNSAAMHAQELSGIVESQAKAPDLSRVVRVDLVKLFKNLRDILTRYPLAFIGDHNADIRGVVRKGYSDLSLFVRKLEGIVDYLFDCKRYLFLVDVNLRHFLKVEYRFNRRFDGNFA